MERTWEEKYGMLRRLLAKTEEPLQKGIAMVHQNGFQLSFSWACPEIANRKYKVLLTSEFPNATRVNARLYPIDRKILIEEKSLNCLLDGFEQAITWLKKYN